jgi:hypothetical protein
VVVIQRATGVSDRVVDFRRSRLRPIRDSSAAGPQIVHSMGELILRNSASSRHLGAGRSIAGGPSKRRAIAGRRVVDLAGAVGLIKDGRA